PAHRPAGTVLGPVEWPGGSGLLCDAMTDVEACRALVLLIASGGSIPAESGRFAAEPTSAFGDPATLDRLDVVPGKAEQSNSAVLYGDRFLFKVFRRVA